ncbi:MAG TPA: cytochrome c3 family protein [Steroidobacteraceae bacterium]|nr:cytochrome c3 family protein [Steroidobacteraceae bacterium]
MIRNLLPSYLRRVAIACALAAALLLLPLPASGGLIWNVGAGVGYLSLIFALALYLYPLRGEGIAHRRLFTVTQHRRIGWIALALAVLHTVILLVAQPLIGHYLLPSAPLYMLCGLAALLALGVLVPTGISARTILRRAAPARGSSSSIVAHAVLAALLLGLLGAHILGSGQLLDGPVKAVTCCVLLGAALLWSAWRPLSRRTRPQVLSTVLPSAITLAALLFLPTPIGSLHLLQTAATPGPLHAYFPHEKHRTVGCITCHHNFVDTSGAGSCYDCHRGTRDDLPQGAEATFHGFCRDCHRALAVDHAKHGPVRECSGCHAAAPTEAVLSNTAAICQTSGYANPCLSPSQAADQRSRVFQAADAWGFR